MTHLGSTLNLQPELSGLIALAAIECFIYQ